MRIPATLLLTGLLLAAGCGPGVPPETELQGVVVILLDTLRADHLGCYGYERPTSPVMDALAAEGVRFEQVVSSAPWTLPSVSALLAGRYSERVWENNRLTTSLVEALRDADIETAAFTEGGFVSRHFAHDRGFTEFVELEGAVQLLQPGEKRDPTKTGGIEVTFDRAGQWLEGIGERRFFLFVHTYEPHIPYTHRDFAQELDAGRLGPSYTLEDMEAVQRRQIDLTGLERRYLTALYDGDIRSSDRHVGRLLEHLANLGLAQRVAVIVTSDHGEELGEDYPHNAGNHGHALLDSQLLVPLILRDPSRDYPVRSVSQQVRLIDLLPTVADLLDVAPGPGLDGRSLLPLLTGEETDARIALVGQTKRGPWRVGLRWMGHKYIRTIPVERRLLPLEPEPPRKQLYDLGADPGERNNLAAERETMVRMLEAQLLERHPGLDRHVSPDAANELDPDLVERLRSLGYLD